jgi:penicillin-binding protein 2
MSTGAIYNGMGQGDVLVTPIQLANYVAAIANKGWYYTPHIVKAIDGNQIQIQDLKLNIKLW